MSRSRNARVKLGIVGAEFFDLSLGRRGGFGKIAQTVARYFNGNPALGVDAVLLHGFREAPSDRCEVRSGDTRVLLRPAGGRLHLKQWLAYRSLLREEQFDVLLTINYASSFRRTFLVLPRTPIIVWAHDPRTPADWVKIGTLQIPGQEGRRPEGTLPDDCTSLGGVVRASRWLGRPVLLAAPEAFIADRVAETYAIRAPVVRRLPVFLEFEVGTVVKGERPRVIFVGRLDPIKRPWIFFELARLLPHVEFVCLGQARPDGNGGWISDSVPGNLKVLGHVDDQVKVALLASAWVLVNTSIHESLPMSFLEALACETPIVSCQEAGGIVSRFGIYTGRWDGTGLDGLPRFLDGVKRLLEDTELRVRLGREGRAWVEETHTAQRFLCALHGLFQHAGIGNGVSPEFAEVRPTARALAVGGVKENE